jgi:acyl carrier protein phosphodiesterase
MNFLAHAYLSFDNPEILTGNMIGDFVKGRDFSHLPSEIQKGVQLHRKIDHFTDKHEIFKNTVYRISDIHGKYRFVIADVFYDHFLAKNWNIYHSKGLETFTKDTYSTLHSFENNLPEKFIYALGYMEKNNWLYNYQHLNKLEMFIKGISNRSKYGINLETSIEDLKTDYKYFENDFKLFFNDIISFSKSEI